MAAFPKQLIQAVLKKKKKKSHVMVNKGKITRTIWSSKYLWTKLYPHAFRNTKHTLTTVYAMRHETYENVRNHYFYAFLYPCWCCGCVHVPLWEFHCHYIASWSRDFRCQYMKSKCRATKPWSHSLLRLKTLYLWKLPVHQQSIRLNQGRKEKLKSF